MANPDIIIRAAYDLVVESGLAELTLRPLADRAGINLPAVMQAMGTKDALIHRLAAAAMSEDALFRAAWRQRADVTPSAGHGLRALLAEAALDDWITRKRHLACLMLDLIQDGARGGPVTPELRQWIADAGRFWAELMFGDPAASSEAFGYVIDEASFSLAAHGNAVYGLMRALCLRRFIAGTFPPIGEEPGWSDQLADCIAALKPADDGGTITLDGKRGNIALAAGRLIVARGIEQVTHRSVAGQVGVPASTVVYHFGSRDALVVAGLHAIVTEFRQSLPQQSGQQGGLDDGVKSTRDLVKATSIIALAALRHPGLCSHALDMRRRRGENIDRDTVALLDIPLEHGFDRCMAQVLSITLFGMRMVALALGTSEQQSLQGAFARMAARRSEHQV